MLAIHSLLPARHATKQTGAVAIIVALSIVVLIGFAGLVLDLGRLYVNKSELQTAADSCALAAVSGLVCESGDPATCHASNLVNAENAGRLAASRNRRDLQSTAVDIDPADIRFSMVLAPNAGYLSRAAGANPASKYAMCIARSNGIVPWFMGLLGQGPSDVSATAVAKLDPSANFCLTVPMGLCVPTAGSYSPHSWITENFTGNEGKEDEDVAWAGQYLRWVDFTPNAGGANEIKDLMSGIDQVCDMQIGSQVKETGMKQGVKYAFNTRFGLYKNYSISEAPPDFTGYAYPTTNKASPVIGQSQPALDDYLLRKAAHTGFDKNLYDGGKNGDPPGKASTSAEHLQYGAVRRLVTVPIIDCTKGQWTIKDVACVLLLNPMSKGSQGTVYIEYEGLASDASSPCLGTGGPGGGGTMPVPTLMQ